MEKEATYKEKFALLDEWMPSIVETVKKDLKNDHLKQDFQFAKHYLQGKNPNKVETAELASAYSHAMRTQENGEAIAEFMANRWILRNSELYHFFESELSRVNPEFTEIKELGQEEGDSLIKKAIEEFGALNTYVFSILNSVAFNKEHISKLKTKISEEAKEKARLYEEQKETKNLEDLKRSHEREMARLTDKYEKKISGLQRKYIQDVEALKKQIGNFQKKLQAN